MLLKNVTSNTVDIVLHGMGRIKVKPEETIEIADIYCLPRRGENPHTPLPPIMEQIAPQLQPVDPKEVQAKLSDIQDVELLIASKKSPEFTELAQSGVPPARARLKIAAELAARRKEKGE